MEKVKGINPGIGNCPESYYVQHYYFGKEKFSGINVREGSFRLAQVIFRTGILLGDLSQHPKGFYGINTNFYDTQTYLFGPLIVAESEIKKECVEDNSICSNERVPKSIITLLGNSEENILKMADILMLRLP